MDKSTYTNPNCAQFVEDMQDVNLEVKHYVGRFFWEGPSVTVSNIQDALSNTHIPCQWDHMGLDFIVYPKSKGND